jgi:sugar lactone lactonase YvrE
MKSFHRFFGALALLLVATGVSVFAAGVQVEGTPVPTRPKPDLSSMKFLIGTWTCTDLSSRRPGPFTITEVYSMDPSGYWIVRDDTTHKASWIPREFQAQSKYTYDAMAKRWIRITLGDEGNYAVATAPMPVGNKKTYTYVIQAKAPDIVSYAPQVYAARLRRFRLFSEVAANLGGQRKGFSSGGLAMAIFRQTIAFVVIGLLAGCANPSPSSIMPGAGPNQTQSLVKAYSGKAYTGRVLYIADIDGQPGVGQILVYTAGMKNPQFLRAITNGTGRPFGLWVDSQNILYVANEPNKYPASVTEFKPGASSPFFEISSFKGYPESVAVDAKQDVYVNESVQDEGFVQEFAPGSHTAERTIDTGVGGYAFTPGSMTFDPQGNLIVAEQAGLDLQIVKIAPGALKATPVNLDLEGNNINGPGMGMDKAGNMYVASGEGATVSVFAPGQTEPSRTISSVAGYGLTGVTARGAVYQASGNYTVTEIAPGSNSATYTLSCSCSAQGAAVSK